MRPVLTTTVWLAAAFLLLSLGATAESKDQPVLNENVRLTDGPVVGNVRDAAGILAFKGIPFATAPVGPLRWREPQDVTPWQEPRSAKAFGPRCWQTKIVGAPPLPGTASEDCLYLNVWTGARAASERRPVMVWIHGGGFLLGTASTDLLDGGHLAAAGVVVVTLNYRLGVFGFLAHPQLTGEGKEHASGMYGILDQIAALRWVHDNIAAFGGDPGNVTIFGESAGSHAVSILMASPLAKGLFHKAIGESGAFWASEHGAVRRVAAAEKMGLALQAALGAGSLAAMRQVSAADLQAATPWSLDTDPGVSSYSPVVDGYVLPDEPTRIFAQGKQNDVPLIAGWNAHESGPFRGRALPHKDAASFIAAAREKYGAAAMSAFASLYPAATDAEATTSAFRLSGDEVIAFPTWWWVDLQARTGRAPVHAYHFTKSSPYNPAPDHASEIAYVFGNFPPKGGITAGPDDIAFSQIVRRYWTNFAKTGNPNGSGLPQWDAYTTKDPAVLELTDKNPAHADAGIRRFLFLRSYWEKHWNGGETKP